jgi:hypothetical protein
MEFRTGDEPWTGDRLSSAGPAAATVNIHAAKTKLSRLVDAPASGEEIIIAKSGKPVARAPTCWQPLFNGHTMMVNGNITAGASRMPGSTGSRYGWIA